MRDHGNDWARALTCYKLLPILQLEDTQNKLKHMGNLMKDVRAWLDDVETFLKLLRGEKDPFKENKIQEKIEVCFNVMKSSAVKKGVITSTL